MAQIRTHGIDVDLDEPFFVEGFPGIGLVGKIATDHLIRSFDMRYYASVQCEGLPRIGVYREGDRTVMPPVRIYVSESANLLALQSDVPIAARAVDSVAGCLTAWLRDQDVCPVYLSGYPAERDGAPELYAVATGEADGILEEYGIGRPTEDGAVSGPTGALLNRAAQFEFDSVGLVVESNPKFPDPEAARVLIEEGIAPIADLDVDVSDLVDHAAEIRQQREQLAQRMQEVDQEESSQARPMQMYQ